MDTIKIRRAKIEDAKFLPSLADQIGYPTGEKEITKRLREVFKQREDILLVAVIDKKVVGFVQGITRIEVLTPKTMILGGLIVDSNYQKMGIGRELMTALEKYAVSHKFKMILVPTNIKRKEVHPFYEKIGYQKQKVQIIYYKAY